MRPLFQKIVSLLGVFFGVWLGIRYLLPLFSPFLLGAGLALAAEPVTSFFWKKMHLPRGVCAGIGVSMTFFLISLALLILGALIVREMGLLAGVLPDLGVTAKSGISALSGWLQDMTQYAPGGIRDHLSRSIGEFFSSGTALLDKAVRYGLGLASGVLSHVPDGALSLGTGIISSFMISAKLPKIKTWLSQRLPKNKLQPVLEAAKRIKAAIGGWLLAQLKLAGITWTILTIGFVLLRISFAPLWAVLVALVDMFPILGTGTVLIPWSIISLLQDNHPRAIGLIGIYALVSLTRSALEPKLVGKQLGLDPLITLIALYAGYKIWGIGGMLLAPLLAVTAMQLSEISSRSSSTDF